LPCDIKDLVFLVFRNGVDGVIDLVEENAHDTRLVGFDVSEL
jgi:hypothetical protein